MIPIISDALLTASGSMAGSMVSKATVIAALGLIGARLAHKNRAAVRHTLLAATFGVMLLLPIGSLVAPPVRIAVAVRNGTVSPPPGWAVDEIPPVTPANVGVGIAPATTRPSRFSLFNLFLAVWMAGAVLVVLPMITALRHIRSVRRSALPWRHGQALLETLARDAGVHRRVDLLLHEAMPGPMTCGVVHPAIVLSPEAHTWNEEDLNRALVHELEHVRRGDWVSLCIARTVAAVYWFHPLVWMACRQLALEAERSCDDAVLRRFEATAYADQLVGLAQRMSLGARARTRKSPLLAMANRADLAVRVGALLDSRQRRGRAGTLQVAFVSAAAAVLLAAVSPLRMVGAQQATSAAAPVFDAVSVKLVDPNMRGEHLHDNSDPGRLRMNANLHSFIVHAYGITEGQLGGEPDWFKSRLYSVEAVTSAPASPDQMMLMLRGVLADRFQLKLRQEDRDLPVYALEVAAGGPKFKPLQPGAVPKDPPDSPGTIARSYTSVQELMKSLNGVSGGRLTTDRPVVDRTLLTGEYNIQVRTAIEIQTDDSGRRTVQFPSLFHDLQSQLGLKLVPDHLKMPYFVVERAAEPTKN